MNRTRTFFVAVALAWLAAAPVFAGPTETIGVTGGGVAGAGQRASRRPSPARRFAKAWSRWRTRYGAEAGARVLEAGGNAIDAAVAIAYALNVVEPQSAGIGGGGFMMIHLARSGETVVIDSRETAPAGATRDMFVGVPNATLQGVAVGVPGMVRGTALALRRYGSTVARRGVAAGDRVRRRGVRCDAALRRARAAAASQPGDGTRPRSPTTSARAANSRVAVGSTRHEQAARRHDPAIAARRRRTASTPVHPARRHRRGSKSRRSPGTARRQRRHHDPGRPGGLSGRRRARRFKGPTAATTSARSRRRPRAGSRCC